MFSMHIEKQPFKLFLVTFTFYCSIFLCFSSSGIAQGMQEWGSTPGTANYCVVDGVPTLKCLEIVYGNILAISSALIMLILFLMLVYGGFTYLTSMGDSNKMQKGRKILVWALIGVAVYATSYLILFIIDMAFMGGKGTIFKLSIPGPGGL